MSDISARERFDCMYCNGYRCPCTCESDCGARPRDCRGGAAMSTRGVITAALLRSSPGVTTEARTGRRAWMRWFHGRGLMTAGRRGDADDWCPYLPGRGLVPHLRLRPVGRLVTESGFAFH